MTYRSQSSVLGWGIGGGLLLFFVSNRTHAAHWKCRFCVAKLVEALASSEPQNSKERAVCVSFPPARPTRRGLLPQLIKSYNTHTDWRSRAGLPTEQNPRKVLPFSNQAFSLASMAFQLKCCTSTPLLTLYRRDHKNIWLQPSFLLSLSFLMKLPPKRAVSTGILWSPPDPRSLSLSACCSLFSAASQPPKALQSMPLKWNNPGFLCICCCYLNLKPCLLPSLFSLCF